MEQKVTNNLFATLKMRWSNVEDLWIAGSGIVTALHTQVGESISSGTLLLDINTSPVISWHTLAPFHRSLAEGDTGLDVQMLASLLASTGDLQPSEEQTTYFNSAIADAVINFNQRFGLGTTSDFDYTKIVWLPTETVIIGKSDLQVSQEVVGRTSGYTTRPELLEAHLFDFSRPLSSWDNASIILSNNLEIQLEDREIIPANKLQAIERVVEPGADTVNVQVEQRLGAVSLVPVTAIQRSSSGAACIYDNQQQLQFVDIIGGEAGIVYLSPIVQDKVLANPTDIGLINCSSIKNE